VIDNGSVDGTVDMVRSEFPACRLLETGANLGFGRANDLALPQASGRFILLLNPDTRCPAGSLADLWRELARRPAAAAVGPALIDGQGRPTASYGDFPAVWHHWLACLDPPGCWLPRRWRGRGLGRIARPGEPARPVDYLKGACLLLRGEALAQIGPLDERFFLYFEESDWCRRARASGWEIYLCPSVAVMHGEGRATARASDFSLEQFQHSYRLYVAKHLGTGRVAWLRLALFCEHGLKGILNLIWPRQRATRSRRARIHLRIAALQLRGHLTPTPPARPLD
jgi:N-acetylglucosaminyl-diphospho-decaprenol L-rhamnosyltransferase